jgi:hypothetical protein
LLRKGSSGKGEEEGELYGGDKVGAVADEEVDEGKPARGEDAFEPLLNIGGLVRVGNGSASRRPDTGSVL